MIVRFPKLHPQHISGPSACISGPLKWFIIVHKANHSAFNGYHWTESRYSEVQCQDCKASWRTKANYVEHLKHGARK